MADEKNENKISERIAKKAVLAAMSGTILEWYDVFLVSSGALYLAYNFFPKQSPVAAVASVFLVFAIGFFIRPVGALVFSHYGDKIGRKNMLLITILISGLATGSIGLLPSYAQIGIWAIILLIILRLIVGFGLGGEWGGAILMAVENVKKNRGFWGSFIQSTVGIGLILGSTAFFILSGIYPLSVMYSWGWRIPFLLAFLVLAVALYLRFRIPETIIFEAVKKEKKIVKVPLIELFRHKNNVINVIYGILFVASSSSIYYVSTGLIPTLYEINHVVSIHYAQLGLMLFGALNIVAVISGGILSDKFGRRTMLIVQSVSFLALIYLAIIYTTPTSFLVFLGLFGIAHGLGYTSEGLIITELFPANIRYTGNSFTYQFGNAYIGGPAPYASYALGSISYFLYPLYGIIFAVIAIPVALIVKETNKISLDIEGEDKSIT
jgi:MFS family permease